VTTRHGSDAFALGRHELWSLREDVQVELAPDGGPALLRSRWGDVTVQQPSSLIRKALHRMCLGPISLENVVEDPARLTAARAHADHADGSADVIPVSEDVQWLRLYRVLERLQPLVTRSLGLDDGQPLLSVVPLTPSSRFRPVPLSPDVPVRLSRFASLRTDGSEYRLESPLSLHRVHLHRPEAISLVAALGQPITPAACAATVPHRDPVAADALAYLAAAGMVVAAEGPQPAPDYPPVFAEDNDQTLAGWSAADLAFHTHSTFGRHDHDIGAVYPRGESRPAEPAVKPPAPEPGIPLYRPTWEKLVAADPPLTVAIEGRRSTRSYGAAPVTAAELGELLYRTARVRSLSPAAAGTAGDGEEQLPDLSDRPYPGGGACYELELYVTVGQCAGIATGVYHYDPLGHQLEPVNADHATVDKLLAFARAAADAAGPPQVLITLTARLQRLTWKYQGITYAVVLKHVGVLTQMLYLVAAAMRLAACALGSVNIDATARAFGTDWRTEPSVGQFMIGSAPPVADDHRTGWLPANDASWPGRARTGS
jgi:SagB-type dehydrogenase family enzyme